MLTKQSRQFEQWAQDKETLMATKARIAAEQQAKTKKNSAAMLALLGTALTLVACFGFMNNQDSDWAIVLVFGSIVALYGLINSKQ